MIDKDKVHHCLKRKIPVFTYDVIGSTSEQARLHLKEYTCERAVFIARGQTAGKGRLGRSFYSPADTGIYMTYVFRIDELCRDTLRVTTAASVAVAKALDCGVQIKWVNDLYLNGKKVCGILTETVIEKYTYVLIGVGINLTTVDFPAEISRKAGAVGFPLDKEKTIAAICDYLSQIADDISDVDYIEYYRRNMFGIGKQMTYFMNGKKHTAIIEGITEMGELIIMENNIKKLLCSSEISICSLDTDNGCEDG